MARPPLDDLHEAIAALEAAHARFHDRDLATTGPLLIRCLTAIHAALRTIRLQVLALEAANMRQRDALKP